MSTLLRTRRLPAKYRLRKNGITEIVYNATPEVFVVLPGTRWLEQRREREARLAAETALMQEEIQAAAEQIGVIPSPVIDTEIDPGTEVESAPESSFVAEETFEDPSLSWTDRMRIASTKLIRRQVSAHA